LTDDSTGKNYMVGINNGQLYVKEVTWYEWNRQYRKQIYERAFA
jgi:hypothetical protein